jgi:hypothetical protein
VQDYHTEPEFITIMQTCKRTNPSQTQSSDVASNRIHGLFSVSRLLKDACKRALLSLKTDFFKKKTANQICDVGLKY